MMSNKLAFVLLNYTMHQCGAEESKAIYHGSIFFGNIFYV